jgi:hypothetical protein
MKQWFIVKNMLPLYFREKYLGSSVKNVLSESACLASLRPSVQTPVLLKKEKSPQTPATMPVNFPESPSFPSSLKLTFSSLF